MSKKETRMYTFEIRSEENEQNGHYIIGRPIVFNSETDLGAFTETIAPGALDNADLKDVRFLINHDTNMIPLARSRNNNANSTMQMMVDAQGMLIRVNLDVEGNPTARSLESAIKRGDVTGMSFMYTVNADKWEGLEDEKAKRTITEIGKVFEVSAVTFPAYQETSIESASRDEALESAKALLESKKAADKETARLAKRKQLLEVLK